MRQEQDRWEDALPHWQHVIRVRTNEPDGYFGLARALIHLQQWDQAREVVDEIVTRDWPTRFGDVRRRGQGLLRELQRSH